ncbi:hypothetical protein [Sporomusa sp.]|uniref:hypothetical protein n=1 Tax=Sporomusa sp. TaxID=2078658 RepID=UPI002BCE5314|nr:hypothetical protein [Sporomusa sp.]HWR42055.1 hypothetical protein [Sporomusa sp.]
MKLFVWVHDRTFHSWSMIDEPCLHTSMYGKATAMVLAETEEQAISLLVEKDEGWRQEDLQQLRPRVFDLHSPSVVYHDIQSL